MSHAAVGTIWPELELHEWLATRDTFHRWLQIIGKVRLVQTPWINHSWHATLYVTSRGLTTSTIPHGQRVFQIDLDLTDHRLLVHASDGRSGGFALAPQTVAAFYRRLMDELVRLDLPVRIDDRPNEVPEPIPFPADEVHRDYDPDAANRFWRILVQVERVMLAFRSRFIGKCSPIHLFWGAMDLAVTRFSGRSAPPHPGGIPNLPDRVTREAYSHEVSSAGFWPGTGLGEAAFYAYAYPAPSGFDKYPVQPEEAYFHEKLGLFILPYESVRAAANPPQRLLSFLQTTYEAAATLSDWDRLALERQMIRA